MFKHFLFFLPLIAGQLYNQQQPSTPGYQTGWDTVNNIAVQGRGIVNQIFGPPMKDSIITGDLNGGVTIQFQLRSYSNPTSSLPNGFLCVCPVGQLCSYFKERPYCFFAFTFIISTPDQSVRYLTTDFIRLNSNGQLPPMNDGVAKRWDENFVVQLPSKPSAIDIFVHHLGSVITKDGSLAAADTLTHTDTWVVPLNDVLPAVGGVQGQPSQNTFDGKLLGTKLSLSYSIACTGNLIGPACDLTCTRSTITQNIAACQSNSTRFFSICQWTVNGQVDNCKNCPWGIKENTYCQDEQGEVLDPHTAGVVGTSYKTATIVLAVLFSIFFILFIIAVVVACLLRRKQSPIEKEMMTYVQTKGGPTTQPLLNSSFRDNDAPTPIPRSNPPSLDTKPIKSALRKPMLPMSTTSNDTRDTSFSNDVPMRPSRSEVV